MKISVISFTQTGRKLSERIAEELEEMGKTELELYTRYRRYAREMDGKVRVQFVETSVSQWAMEQMRKKNAMLFIGACGIAVRAVAPHLTDKLRDVPVLVMDEEGRYVVPILSGHVGGANELAGLLAEKTGAEPVITTATDLCGKFAVDLFARRNGLFIVNREGIVKVTAKVLAGEKITLSIEDGHIKDDTCIPEGICVTGYPPKEPVDVAIVSRCADTPAGTERADAPAGKGHVDAALFLRPREYVIGLGCKKGKPDRDIEEFISRRLEKLDILTEQILAVASISLKKEEPGILAWCRKENIPFLTYTAQELVETEGEFSESEFVLAQTGTGNVCERAAVRACKKGGRLIAGKYTENGMTIAVAKREWSVSFEKREQDLYRGNGTGKRRDDDRGSG